MKKKLLILTIICIIAVSIFSLSACNTKTPINRLLPNNSPWLNVGNMTETSLFNVEKKDGDAILKGTYNIIVQRLENTTVQCGDIELAEYSGYFATSSLEMENGDKISTAVAFSHSYVLKASYIKIEYVGKPVLIAKLNNENKKANITTINGEEETSTTIKHKTFEKKPYIDNIMLYLLARSMPSDTPTATFEVINTTMLKKQSTNIIASKNTELTFADSKVDCRTYEISLNRTFPGKGEPLKCYVATPLIKDTTVLEKGVKDPLGVKSAIVKIVEGDMSYNLISTNVVK